MKKILILVEGSTEERFVKSALVPHLMKLEINIIPKIVSTKIEKNGLQFKGGLSNYRKIKKDLLRLLQDKSAVLVTTMFDYYGLPIDFPGYALKRNGKGIQAAKLIEVELEKDINNKKFLAYLQVHEFEGLLFSCPELIADALIDRTKQKELIGIRKKFKSPEDINDNPATCPSRRILNIFPFYKKPLYGSLIVGRIGLTKIRSECSHFNEWLSKIEEHR